MMPGTADMHVYYICLIALLVSVAHGFIVNKEDKKSSVTMQDLPKVIEEPVQRRVIRSSQNISVKHFAIHGLCNHFKGQKRLYTVMKSKLCQVKDVFIADFVTDICSKKNDDLYKWVSELFDIDGDGSISYFEKQFYDFKY